MYIVTVRILGFEDQQLGHHVVGGGVVHLHAEEDDAILEQAGVGVLGLHAIRGLLHELRHDVTVGRRGLGCAGGGRHETGYALTAGQAVGTGGELCFFTCHESHSPCWLLPMVSGVVTSLSTKP